VGCILPGELARLFSLYSDKPPLLYIYYEACSVSTRSAPFVAAGAARSAGAA